MGTAEGEQVYKRGAMELVTQAGERVTSLPLLQPLPFALGPRGPGPSVLGLI